MRFIYLQKNRYLFLSCRPEPDISWPEKEFGAASEHQFSGTLHPRNASGTVRRPAFSDSRPPTSFRGRWVSISSFVLCKTNYNGSNRFNPFLYLCLGVWGMQPGQFRKDMRVRSEIVRRFSGCELRNPRGSRTAFRHVQFHQKVANWLERNRNWKRVRWRGRSRSRPVTPKPLGLNIS